MLELTAKQLKALAKRIQDHGSGTLSAVVASTRELGVHVECVLSTNSGDLEDRVTFAVKLEADVNMWYINDIDIAYESLLQQLMVAAAREAFRVGQEHIKKQIRDMLAPRKDT